MWWEVWLQSRYPGGLPGFILTSNFQDLGFVSTPFIWCNNRSGPHYHIAILNASMELLLIMPGFAPTPTTLCITFLLLGLIITPIFLGNSAPLLMLGDSILKLCGVLNQNSTRLFKVPGRKHVRVFRIFPHN